RKNGWRQTDVDRTESGTRPVELPHNLLNGVSQQKNDIILSSSMTAGSSTSNGLSPGRNAKMASESTARFGWKTPGSGRSPRVTRQAVSRAPAPRSMRFIGALQKCCTAEISQNSQK
uniref:Kinesin motor domain-containing protein n=1 Tax=Globodera pallida TaxID=36090 RepID=A0A183CG55_GLOPA